MTTERKFAADGLSLDAVKLPPLTTAFKFCETCGRDDRAVPFTGRSHYSGGHRCAGTPIVVVYVFSHAARETKQ